MKIKLYKVHEDSDIEDLKYIDFEINGRMIHFIQKPDYSDPEYIENGYYEKRLFNYEYDNSFKKEFGKLKLNHKITIYHSREDDCSSIAGILGFVHLNMFQRINLGWSFQRNWLQNPENIKWLISIPISILTAYITAKLTSGN